jgi:nucleotide-binding universal stress UspA family protein
MAPSATFGNIVCAVDGSPHGLKAARLASELAAACGAGLTFLTVTKRLKMTEEVKHYLEVENLGTSDPQYVLDEFTKDILDQANAVAQEAGVSDSQSEIKVGQPARTIVEFAVRSKCDAIVLGGRGHGDLEGGFLGSVSHKVASLAKCTVITVK